MTKNLFKCQKRIPLRQKEKRHRTRMKLWSYEIITPRLWVLDQWAVSILQGLSPARTLRLAWLISFTMKKERDSGMTDMDLRYTWTMNPLGVSQEMPLSTRRWWGEKLCCLKKRCTTLFRMYCTRNESTSVCDGSDVSMLQFLLY